MSELFSTKDAVSLLVKKLKKKTTPEHTPPHSGPHSYDCTAAYNANAHPEW